jgi:hypothetical protein
MKWAFARDCARDAGVARSRLKSGSAQTYIKWAFLCARRARDVRDILSPYTPYASRAPCRAAPRL